MKKGGQLSCCPPVFRSVPCFPWSLCSRFNNRVRAAEHIATAKGLADEVLLRKRSQISNCCEVALIRRRACFCLQINHLLPNFLE